MKKLSILWMALLSSGTLLFSAQYIERPEVFTLESSFAPVLSIESFRHTDGWTPVTLSMDKLVLYLWMNDFGQVMEKPEAETEQYDELFSIDLELNGLFLGDAFYEFNVYERNKIRTRMRLANQNLSVKLRIDWTRQKTALILGNNPLELRQASLAIYEPSPGKKILRSSTPVLMTRTELMYESRNETIFYKSRLGHKNRSVVWARKLKRGGRR